MAPVGANVSIYMDTPAEMDIGDHIVTKTGRTYRITHCRIQQRGQHAGRKHLRVDVVEPGSKPQDPDAVIHRLSWYPR